MNIRAGTDEVYMQLEWLKSDNYEETYGWLMLCAAECNLLPPSAKTHKWVYSPKLQYLRFASPDQSKQSNSGMRGEELQMPKREKYGAGRESKTSSAILPEMVNLLKIQFFKLISLLIIRLIKNV